jgi:hypothetical protein
VSREEATAAGGGGGLSGASRDLLLAIALQLQDTNAHVEELRLQYERDRNQYSALMERHYHVHNENLRRIAIAPARRVGTGSIGAAAATLVNNHLGNPKAVLSASPRSLHQVWEEWANGLDSKNKPASQSTREERGKNKHKFCQRKVLWDLVSNLV